jgi:glycosyltransferase involved in cell wall biosynthesis
MPCHNEMHIIKQNITETVNTLTHSNNGSFELIVIDDGSSDGTFEIIKESAEVNGQVKLVKLDKNFGKGLALRKGFEHVEGKYVCFLDGDLDLHPKLISTLMNYMKKENADVVVGSKRHPQSVVSYPLHRRFLSMIFQGYTRTIFGMGIKDSQVGLKLFKKEVLDDIFPRVLVKKYAFDVELLVNAHNFNYRIVEAPIEMDFKNIVGSDVDIPAVGRIFVDTCAIFYRSKILHYYDNYNGIHKAPDPRFNE